MLCTMVCFTGLAAIIAVIPVCLQHVILLLFFLNYTSVQSHHNWWPTLNSDDNQYVFKVTPSGGVTLNTHKEKILLEYFGDILRNVCIAPIGAGNI